MAVQWYINPWDIAKRRNRWKRQSAMIRHIPAKGNPAGSDFVQTDILGGRLLTKCEAPSAVHTAIQADPDFILLVDNTAAINALRPTLLGFGYSMGELAPMTNLRQLLDLLTTAGWHRPKPSANNSTLGLEVSRTASNKRRDQIDRRVRG